jgi:hypothetical protein
MPAAAWAVSTARGTGRTPSARSPGLPTVQKSGVNGHTREVKLELSMAGTSTSTGTCFCLAGQARDAYCSRY